MEEKLERLRVEYGDAAVVVSIENDQPPWQTRIVSVGAHETSTRLSTLVMDALMLHAGVQGAKDVLSALDNDLHQCGCLVRRIASHDTTVRVEFDIRRGLLLTKSEHTEGGVENDDNRRRVEEALSRAMLRQMRGSVEDLEAARRVNAPADFLKAIPSKLIPGESEHSSAIRLVTEALADDRWKEIHSRLRLCVADALLKGGDAETAESMALAARDATQAASDSELYFHSLLLLARCALHRGASRQAIRRFNQAIRAAGGSAEYLAAGHHGLGATYISAAMYDEALACFLNAGDLRRKVDDPLEPAATLASAADLLEPVDALRSVQFYREALSSLPPSDASSLHAIALRGPLCQ